MYVEALKEILLGDEWLQAQFHSSDAGKAWVMRHGPGTGAIARKLKVSDSKARYHLNKLSKLGVVNKHCHGQNFCCWFPSHWDYK